MQSQIVPIQSRQERSSQEQSSSNRQPNVQRQNSAAASQNQQSEVASRRSQQGGGRSVASMRSQNSYSIRNNGLFRGNNAVSSRGSNLHLNSLRNQYSVGSTSSASGVLGIGIHNNNNGSRGSRNNSNIRSISSQQNNNNSDRQIGNANVQYSENSSIFHENSAVNQIYNQEWEYRTFVHYFELVYHQIMICLFAFLVTSVFLYSSSYIIPMILFFIYDFIGIVRSSYRLTLYSCFKSRVKCKIIMLELICLIVAKVLTIVAVETSIIRYFVIGIPIIIYGLLRIIIYRIEKKSEDCSSIINFFVLGYRLFIILLTFSVCMKQDTMVTWDWSQTFWSYWIIFSVLIGVTFGAFLMLVSKFFQVCLQEAEFFELKGIFWAFFNVAGLTTGSCLFQFGMVDRLDNNGLIGLKIFQYYIIGYFTIYLILSTFWRNSILFYLKQMSTFDPDYVRKSFQLKLRTELNPQLLDNQQQNQQVQNNLQDQEENQNVQNNINNNADNNNNQDQKNESKNEKQQDQPLFIPRFLEKLTNTFFKKTDPKMNPNEYYKQKQKEWQEKEEEKKQKQQLKQQTKKSSKKDQEAQLHSKDLKESDKKTSQLSSISNSKKLINDKQHGRSASSIVFDYNSFQQNSSGKFGFANELFTSIKKGANNIMRNMSFSKGSQHGISQQENINREDQLQIPNTESDELNLNSNKQSMENECVLEFETEESERTERKDILNKIGTKRNKEQHVSIIETPASGTSTNANNQQSIEAYYAGQSDIQNTGQNQGEQNQPVALIQHNSDDEGELNTIIEEKSILDQTNNNNIINHFQQRERNLSQYDAYYNNKGLASQDNTPPPRVGLNDKNINGGFNQNDKEGINVLNQDNNNPNQHRRFLSDQPQINFNHLNKSPPNNRLDSSNKLPLQPFEEESSIYDQSEQSKCQQDQSSILSCSRMDKSSNTCLVCFDKTPDSVFMDCGHGGVCYDCALEIWKKTGECYLCRLKIVQVLQVDLKSKAYGLIKVISSTQMVQKEVDESSLSSHPPLDDIEEEEVQEQE